QLGRGDTVPEFDRALFAGEALGVLPELVDTRYGFHVVLVARRIAGRAIPFDAARERIGSILRERSTERALAQYAQILADSTMETPGSGSPDRPRPPPDGSPL
ncbi:MAG: peptidylprolyl isomerase, partial [Burkholderiales bacterium]